jgi:glutathione peroxidase
MRCIRLLMAASAVAILAGPAAADEKGDKKVGPALNFKMKGIDGKDVDLSQYQGKVVMFVNVASRCGLTPQYAGLEKLHEKYGPQGLVIVGVPANEFLQQEPGTDAEISQFCTNKYGVKFVMLSKVVVKGDGITPLYKYLTNDAGEKFSGPITWNFEKFIVNRQGEVVARFAPRTAPEDPKMTSAIEAELNRK